MMVIFSLFSYFEKKLLQNFHRLLLKVHRVEKKENLVVRMIVIILVKLLVCVKFNLICFTRVAFDSLRTDNPVALRFQIKLSENACDSHISRLHLPFLKLNTSLYILLK